MADTPAAPLSRMPTGHPGMGAPETHVGRQSSIGVDLGIPEKEGQQRNAVEREPDHGLGITIDGKDASIQRVDSSQEKPAGQEGDQPTREGEEAPAKPDEQGTLPALPAFDPAKPEAVEAYDKAFLGNEGKGFNMAALSADWSKNVKLDPKTGDFDGGLSEDTYKWLETKGIDRATAETIQAGQVAAIKLQRQEVFSLAGGQEKYQAAVAWAQAGSYTPEQRQQFNAALNAGGAQRSDAVDLLMNRYDKANPARRPASPARTMGDRAVPAGGTGNEGGAKPYANYSEYQADLRKARTTNDQALLNQTRARLKASPFYSGNAAK